MLKKIKLNNSTVLLIGIILIFVGICTGFIEIFVQKKDKAFSDMNIMLYEDETPKLVQNEDDLPIEENKETNDENDHNGESSNESTNDTKYNFIGILEIPKINIKRGFLNLDSRYNNVDYNITVIKGSTFPDQTNNNLILAAHSGICPVCYFNDLYKLTNGDVAYLYYNNKKYSYKIVNIYEVNKDGTVPIYRDYSKSVLTLITCTRNSDTKQTVYILELFNEDYY